MCSRPCSAQRRCCSTRVLRVRRVRDGRGSVRRVGRGRGLGRDISTGLIVIGVLIVIVSALGGQAWWLDLSKCSFFYMVVLMFVTVATSLSHACLQGCRHEENLSSGWNVADAETKRDIQVSALLQPTRRQSSAAVQLCCSCAQLHTVVDERMSAMRNFVRLLALEIVGLICTCIVS